MACGGVQAVQRGVCGPGVEGGDGAAASGGRGAAAQLPAAQAAHPGQPGAVREAGQRGPVLQLLLPAGQLPAVPGCPRAQAPVLALPQAARRLVPGAPHPAASHPSFTVAGGLCGPNTDSNSAGSHPSFSVAGGLCGPSTDSYRGFHDTQRTRPASPSIYTLKPSEPSNCGIKQLQQRPCPVAWSKCSVAHSQLGNLLALLVDIVGPWCAAAKSLGW